MRVLDISIGFAMGAVVGSAASFFILKKRMDKKLEEEFQNYKESFSNPNIVNFFYESEKKKAESSQKKETEESCDVVKYTKDQKKKKKEYTDYTSFYNGSKSSKIDKEDDEVVINDFSGDPDAVPVIISPDEFGDEEGYAQISLLYTTDGVLIDEDDNRFESTECLCSDYEEHFDEYESDAVYMRNDRVRTYYEILKSLKSYKEICDQNEKIKLDSIMVDE